jgi:hypothetical protein
MEARLSSKTIRLLCGMDWYTVDRGMLSAYEKSDHVITRMG